MQFSHRRNVGCFVTNQHRCLQNLHSRLLEIRRRGLLLTEIHDQDPLLAKKIFRSPHFDRRLGLTRNIQAIHALLQECEDTERKVRLSAWSEKMTKDKAALAWLRRKPQLTHVNVTADDTGPASMSVQDAIANVAVFWRQIWHRPKLNVHTVWPEIQQLVPAHAPSVWAPLTGTHLKAAAYDSRNRAAGLDGWTPQELILFNMDMWNAVADFIPIVLWLALSLNFGSVSDKSSSAKVISHQHLSLCMPSNSVQFVSVVLFGEYVRKHSLTTRMPKLGFAVFFLLVSMVASRAGVLMMRSLPFCSKPTKTGLLEVWIWPRLLI